MPRLLPLLKRRPVDQLYSVFVLTSVLVADEVHFAHRRFDGCLALFDVAFNGLAGLGRGICENGRPI
jgi:hypothetical protein